MLISGAGLFCLTLALVEGGSWGWTSATIIALFAVAVAASPCSCGGRLHTTSPDVPRQPAAHPLLHRGQHRDPVHRPGHGRHVPDGRHLPGLRARLHRAARRPGADGDAPGRAGGRAQRRAPQRPHRAAPAGRGRRRCRSRSASSCWRSSAATPRCGTSCGVSAFLGIGMGLAMPTLSAASMASLPPQVRGVGSGSLNTMRQIGFTVGVALVVAIFSHTVAQNAQHATRQAVRPSSRRSRSWARRRRAPTSAPSSRTRRPRRAAAARRTMTTAPLQGARAVAGVVGRHACTG